MNKRPNQWQLQEAKNKLSQLIKNADKGTPQYITVHGRNTAVILSTRAYEKLKRPISKLSSTLLMPILEEEDLFVRSRDTGKDVDL
ncbi:MAG: type II toxin-antitoxin system Phd/YefM family antitoxin [Gammaproteobacteria bacterium]